MLNKEENDAVELNDNEMPQENIKEEKELTDFEKKMQSHGWNPNGELSAEDWIDNGFKVKNKKIDSLFNAVENLKNKLDRQETDAYAKAKADLEQQRIAAIEEADLDRVRKIEEQQQTMVDPSIREYADSFVNRNKEWLQGTSYRDMEMAAICGVQDRVLVRDRLSPKEHFERLDAFMREKYPDYFGVETPMNAVEGKQKVAIKTAKAQDKKLSWNDLDKFQKQAAKNMQRKTGMTIDEYLDSLQKLGN